MSDDAKVIADDLRLIADNVGDGDENDIDRVELYKTAEFIERQAAEIATLKVEIERLTPKSMTTVILEEIAALFREQKVDGFSDWEAGSTHIYSRDGDVEYSPFGARMMAEQLLRKPKETQ